MPQPVINSLLRRRVHKTTRTRRLVYDKTADSAMLRESIRAHGLRLIAPFRKRQNEDRARKINNQDRHFYKLRYRVERCFGWFTHLRRLNIRYENYAHLCEGFRQLASLFIILTWL